LTAFSLRVASSTSRFLPRNGPVLARKYDALHVLGESAFLDAVEACSERNWCIHNARSQRFDVPPACLQVGLVAVGAFLFASIWIFPPRRYRSGPRNFPESGSCSLTARLVNPLSEDPKGPCLCQATGAGEGRVVFALAIHGCQVGALLKRPTGVKAQPDFVFSDGVDHRK
jgi:hypothetical protein